MLFNSYRSSLLKYTFQYESIDTRHVSLAGPRIRFQLRFRFDPIRIYIYGTVARLIYFSFFFFPSLNDLVKSTSERQVQTREEKKKKSAGNIIERSTRIFQIKFFSRINFEKK